HCCGAEGSSAADAACRAPPARADSTRRDGAHRTVFRKCEPAWPTDGRIACSACVQTRRAGFCAGAFFGAVPTIVISVHAKPFGTDVSIIEKQLACAARSRSR